MKKLITLFCVLGLLSIHAQEGELDFSFNGTGKILYENSNFAEARSVLIQPDGMILTGGYIFYNQGDLLVARFDRNGNPDVTFATQGFAYIDLNTEWQRVNDMQLLPDGKIMLLAETDHNGERGCALVRLTADGFLDQTFADSGWVFNGIGNGTTYWNALVQLPGGDLVAGGYIYHSNQVQMALLGYHPNGDLNLNFGDTGVALKSVGGTSTELHALKVTADGKIMAGGTSFFQGSSGLTLIRYEANGQVDMSFAGGNGITIGFNDDAELRDICFQRDGKILAAGFVERSNDDLFAMARVTSSGTLDPGFGTNGKVETAIGRDSRAAFVGVLGDDRIILGGHGDGIWSEDFALARYNSNGSLDNSFSFDGISTKNIGTDDDEVFAGALQSDGKIILVGTSERPGSSFSRYSMSLARFIGGTGSIETSEFDLSEINIYPNPASDELNVSGNEDLEKIIFMDLQGKVLMEVDYNLTMGGIDLSPIPAGVVVMQLHFEENKIATRKLIIRR